MTRGERSAPASRILSFGGAVIDFVATAGGWQARPGGSAWNVALGLAGLEAGAQTAFVGALGDDPFAETLATQAKGVGLDLRFAERVRANTALSVIHNSDPALYTFYDHGGADSAFAGVDGAAWQGVQAAYFGGVTLLRPPADAAFVSCAQEAARRGVLVCYDPNFRPAYAEKQRKTFHEYLPHTGLLKVSQEDLGGLFPGRDPQGSLSQLLRDFPQLTVLLTLGRGGARLIQGDQGWEHPGFAVGVVDTVGAGDASIAGLLYITVFRPEWPPAQRLAFALACGALACTRRGAHAPPLTDVLHLLHHRTLQEEHL
ncbi:Sugar kinase, ribokinase [Deinococcus saxicola]|uniref:carbohydrate kinase family protein n=1 Tax=Deinococcus saxicola TaxID=249406 RepID=UPI0039F10D06